MVLIVPLDNAASGTGRHSGQHSLDRRHLSEKEKTQPFASEGGSVTVRLSDAALSPSGDMGAVRGASGSDKARETISGAAADLDRKADKLNSAAEVLEARRTAFALALAAGNLEEVATAARELGEAKEEAKTEQNGFAFRTSLVVDEPTVAYDPESGRYLPSTRRVAFSVEKDPGGAPMHPSRIEEGEKGVAVIHKHAAVPVRGASGGESADLRLPDTPEDPPGLVGRN